jgi:hypothetical protein
MSERRFRFNEYHPEGWDVVVTVTESQILKYMREYRAKNPDGRIRFNNDLLEEFIVVNWAWEVTDEKSNKENE